MANIALNKPSGGQLILSPEDGTSTETVTIPSVGVGKVLQTKTNQYTTNYSSSSSSWVKTHISLDFTPIASDSTIILFITYGYHYETGTTDANGEIRINDVQDSVPSFTDQDLIGYIGSSFNNARGGVHTTHCSMAAGDGASSPTATRNYSYWVQPKGYGLYIYRNCSITAMEVAA